MRMPRMPMTGVDERAKQTTSKKKQKNKQKTKQNR